MKQPYIYLFFGTASVFFRDLIILGGVIASIISILVL